MSDVALRINNPNTPVTPQTHPIIPPNPTLEFVNPEARLTSPALQFLQQLYAATLGIVTGESINGILDEAFGSEEGSIIYRDEDNWVALSLSEALDAAFGADQGSVIYRDKEVWDALLPGTEGKFLTTHGAAKNPTWEAPLTGAGGGDGGSEPGSGAGEVFLEGSVVFAGSSGQPDENNPRFFWNNTNERLGIGTATPEAPLHVTGRIRFPHGEISNAGQIGLNTTPPPDPAYGVISHPQYMPEALESLFRIGGVYNTSTDPAIMNVQNIWRSSDARWQSHNVFELIPSIEPQIVGNMSQYGVLVAPGLWNSATNVPNLTGLLVHWTVNAGYTGTITTYNGVSVAGVTNTSGGPAIANVRGILMNSISTNNPVATGVTTVQVGIWANGITTGTSGGTTTNYSLRVVAPSGGSSAGTTTNYGLFISGNMGVATDTGVVNNWSFYNNSTANVYLSQGNVGIKTATPTANLHIGTTSGTARIYRAYTDVLNGAWAYLGDWGKTANVATYGTDLIGSGLAYDVSFIRAGAEQIRLTPTGPTAPTQAPGNSTTLIATTAFVGAAVAPLAPLASPAFTGIPTAPTAAFGTNTTQLATTAFVQAGDTFLQGQIDSIATGGGVGTITGVSAGAGLTGGGTAGGVTLSLIVPVTIALGGTNATTAAAALSNLGGAPLISPTFTGDPRAPTPLTGDNDTSIATTAFVTSAISDNTWQVGTGLILNTVTAPDTIYRDPLVDGGNF